MAEYTLYGFAQSGNAYKPALMLELAGADWAPRFVDYFGGETRTPAYCSPDWRTASRIVSPACWPKSAPAVRTRMK